MGSTAAKEKTGSTTNAKTEGKQSASGKKKKVKSKREWKVLLVGISGCGKNTIAKQIKILHCDGPEEHPGTTYDQIVEFELNGFGWKLVNAGGQRAEHREWVQSYEDVVAIIYVAALDEWDVVLPENPKKTRMEESIEVFKSVINHQWFRQTLLVLFMNKKDLFEQKLKQVDMSQTYSDYKGGSDVTAGVEFIKQKYLKQVRKFSVDDGDLVLPAKCQMNSLARTEYLASINMRGPDNVLVHDISALDTKQFELVLDSVTAWLIKKRMEILSELTGIKG